MKPSTATATARPSSSSASDLPPGQRARDDFPRFGTHLHRPPPAIPAAPGIEISGAVRQTFSVPLARLAELPRREQISDLHCVAGWSATELGWAGVPFRSFYGEFIAPAIAGHRPTHLVLEGLDGYRVVEALEEGSPGTELEFAL